MAFQLSPGVNVSEIDLTTVVPSVATSDGAIAGIFRWGPIGERVLVDSETTLVNRFGKPTNLNAETWFTASNFLAYANRLYISRGANTSGMTPTKVVAATVSNNILICSNTANVVAGMYIFQSDNTAVIAGANNFTVQSVNSTAIVMSGSPLSSNASLNVYFANPGTTYTAVGRETNTAIVANLVNQIVLNDTDYRNKLYSANVTINFDSDVLYLAKYPGLLGNSLRVSVCDNATSYQSNVAVGNATSGGIDFIIGSNSAVISGIANTVAATVGASFSTGDRIAAGNSQIGVQYLTVSSISSVTNTANGSVTLNFMEPYRLRAPFSTNSISRYWEFFSSVATAPGQSNWQRNQGNTSAQDEMHIVVVDDDGQFTGTPGVILEVYKGISRATDAKNDDGSGNYYRDVINQNSNYIWWGNDRSTAVSNTAFYLANSSASAPLNTQLTFGSDGYDEGNTSAFSAIAGAYDLFVSPEDIDISLVLQGRPLGGVTTTGGETVANYQMANYIIDNICEVRKDCIALISPDRTKVINNAGNEATSLKNWRNTLHASSYAVMDTGYKYMYDRYADVNRWVPMNGDIAGLCVRTDNTNDAWWSPAGFNRGQIKNSIKLAYNPKKSDRDILYQNNINPVVTFPGQGTVLYGDKTLLSKPSAFDRINVRRLFIVLEKAIAQASKYSLFEFNDAFTRAQFKNLVNPYLRNIKGRRGITDFLVVCDETNNTAQVIDSNQFVGDIYIKPAKSINFIQLNFVAVGTGVQFSEVVGKF
jgi:phage tail sheath protein FI